MWNIYDNLHIQRVTGKFGKKLRILKFSYQMQMLEKTEMPIKH